MSLSLCRPVAGAALNALGAGLKCAAVGRERFAVLMAAQVVCACAQLFILGLPARVAAVWFGEAELATATSIGVFGNQVWPAPSLPPASAPAPARAFTWRCCTLVLLAYFEQMFSFQHSTFLKSN